MEYEKRLEINLTEEPIVCQEFIVVNPTQRYSRFPLPPPPLPTGRQALGGVE
jgi:hypothetical protein